MFKKLYNQAVLTGLLRPDGPLLIAQGGGSLDPVAPDLAFVRTVRSGVPTVYLPGSSLKGVLRAHSERILATLLGPEAAEDPFDFSLPRRKAATAAKKDNRTADVFHLSCEADRLFGSIEIAGRLRIGDAYPPDDALERTNQTEVRYGVAIHRAKQSVQVGPFEQEAVTGGAFAFRMTLENYELWMLALVLQVVQDLHEGLVQVGHAKSRGFGSLRVDVPSLLVRWPGARPERLAGAGARASAADREAYRLTGDDEAPLPEGGKPVAEGLYSGYRFDGWEGLFRVLQTLVPAEPVTPGLWQRFLARPRAGRAHGS
jgi:CRISPR-associated protein Csm3